MDNPLLTNVDLEVFQGSKTAIVGPIGSGKSLVLKSLLGQVRIPDGQLYKADQVRFAYCSQMPWLENVSAEENIAQYSQDLISAEAKLAWVTETCVLEDLTKLSSFKPGGDTIGSNGVSLSGGQRQRLVRQLPHCASCLA